MARHINIADQKGRNAEVVFAGIPKKPLIKMITPEGSETRTLRVLKAASANSFEGMMLKYKSTEAVAEQILSADPEIDLFVTGRYVSGTSRIYIDQNLKPVSRIIKTEKVYDPEGNLKEERIPKDSISNILAEYPIKPTGKTFPKKVMYNKLVFAKKYQIKHVNGLTFDFLFETAKELHESDSLAMLGAGPKGNEPLVFQDGGKTYRAFLEGRIQGNAYILLLHLSNLELKSLNQN